MNETYRHQSIIKQFQKMMFTKINPIFQKLIKISFDKLHHQAYLTEVHFLMLCRLNGLSLKRITRQTFTGLHPAIMRCYNVNQLRNERMCSSTKVLVTDVIQSSHYLNFSQELYYLVFHNCFTLHDFHGDRFASNFAFGLGDTAV
jgi:hypothetical protein